MRLPKLGKLRGLLAILFSFSTLLVFSAGRDVPEWLLVITALVIGEYLGYVESEPAPEPEVIGAPFIPEPAKQR